SFAVERGQAQRAACLFGAASGLRGSIGAAPTHALFAAERERGLARVQALLSSVEFEGAWNDGLSLGYDGILEMALAPHDGRAAAQGSEWPPGLTPREREIATLLVDRLSNREIAGRLFISDQTVETHVKRVLSKLGVSSRNEVAGLRGTQAAPTGRRRVVRDS
ncbi:MAG: LuxR C-terminal-related transcriptional regulator, partial [Chloroflexota bacterium]